MMFVGVDWAEAHHDVYVCDDDGARLVQRRLPEGIDGVTGLHELIAELVDEPDDVVVGIETDRGLWIQSLVEAGYAVYAINPKAASRYRDRHTLSGAKSDPGDAKMLASWSAPIVTTTAKSPATAIWPRASRSSPGHIRT